MIESLQPLLSEPALIQAIAIYDLHTSFSAETIRRAQAYLSPGIISEITAEILDTDDEFEVAISIASKIAGTDHAPYITEVDFFFDDGTLWDLEFHCSCPVRHRCKHAAALMTRLIDVATRAPAGNPGSAPAFIPRAIDQWLNELVPAPKQPQPAPKTPTYDKFLAYCLEHSIHGNRDIRFTLHPASRAKDGSVKIELTEARADLANPPKYIADEDLRICIAHRRHPRRYDDWTNSLFPEGREGARLIEMALATGRLYYIIASDYLKPADRQVPITQGPALTVELAWDSLPSGNMRPVIRGLPDSHHILYVEPPLYLDFRRGLLGPLTSDQPLHLLKKWKTGPELAADIVAQVSAKIEALPGYNVPAPVALPTETRPDCPPTPFFTITRKAAHYNGRLQDFILGHLAFQYGDSPPLAHQSDGGAPRQHTELRDGTRITWRRDPAAEIVLAHKLATVGIAPLSTRATAPLVDDSLISAFYPADPEQTSTSGWLHCLDHPEMEVLRRQGWVITIDPKSGLTVHHASDFFPAIEAETDHGIDWFRFDVSFELDGQKRSLIPLIAQAIAQGLPPATAPDLPQWITLACENPLDGLIRLPARQFLEIVDQVRHLFLGRPPGDGAIRLDRLAAAGVADSLNLETSATTRALTELGRSLKNITGLPREKVPASVKATLRPYQTDGFRWLRFMAKHRLNGILADDMGLGKTLQTLAHLAAEHAAKPGVPSLVIAPTSVVPNWAAEAAKFTPKLKTLVLHGSERLTCFKKIAKADLVITSYPLLHRDIEDLTKKPWHCVILDEAQYVKNPKSFTAQAAWKLQSAHRICLSGTPMENHLGELWSLLRFLMPGFLPDEKTFNSLLRRPIERDRSSDAQAALNRRVSPLILRRTKDQVATDLPPKTELIHHVELTKKQVTLYESVRASMDKRVRDAIAAKGLAKSHIIVLDALLKLRQICCHPALLKTPAALKVAESAKLQFLTDELLPQLLEEGRRILLFSQFTSMLALIEAHLEAHAIPFLKLTGQTKDRATLVNQFQTGAVPIFLISLKAGGTGLNLTAADTVIHYDPWWNPAAENQATDRAHRIGQNKPVFVHKLVCRGSIEDRILELQRHKSALVQALLSEETTSLRIDPETLSHLLSPIT